MVIPNITNELKKIAFSYISRYENELCIYYNTCSIPIASYNVTKCKTWEDVINLNNISIIDLGLNNFRLKIKDYEFNIYTFDGVRVHKNDDIKSLSYLATFIEKRDYIYSFSYSDGSAIFEPDTFELDDGYKSRVKYKVHFIGEYDYGSTFELSFVLKNSDDEIITSFSCDDGVIDYSIYLYGDDLNGSYIEPTDCNSTGNYDLRITIKNE